MLRQYLLRPSCPFVGGGSLLLLALLALPSAFAWNSRTFGGLDPNSGSRRLYMLKKSESPQWEDLGWAWGKRSGGPNSAAPSPPNSANWDDLGWAWGKRSPAEGGEAARRAKAHREDPIVSMMANRVVRSMTKQIHLHSLPSVRRPIDRSMFDPPIGAAEPKTEEAEEEKDVDAFGDGGTCLIDDQPLPQRRVPSGVSRAEPPGLLMMHSPTKSPVAKIAPDDCFLCLSPTPPLATIAQLSDEDSVCADIDRWACSSLEEEESCANAGFRQNGSARIYELEQQQQQLSESVLQLSTQFAQVQFRIQQIARAPVEQHNEMIHQLQEFASRSCINLGSLRASEELGASGKFEAVSNHPDAFKTAQMRQLIGELRLQLSELEQFAWQNGQLGPGELPLKELRNRQRLLLDRLREKMRLPLELLDGCQGASDMEQFSQCLEQSLEEAMNPMREKDQLVAQLRTQIFDLERYVQFLQKEVATAASPADSSQCSPSKKPLNASATSVEKQPSEFQPPATREPPSGGGWLSRWLPAFGLANGTTTTQCGTLKNFERNELKNTPQGNHYGDQRAELELAVDELVGVLKKNQILAVDRSERDELSVDELNKCILDGVQEAILSSVRKRFCPALMALLGHGLRPVVAPSMRPNALFSAIGCFQDRSRRVNSRHLRPDLSKFDAKKLEHIWDVISLFVETSRALEMRDAVVGQLSDAFKLESVEGKTATSKQILLCTIEHINSSHGKLRRSPDTMWKAFVCAAMNRNRLPAWIRIIFRSEAVLTKCYNSWSYVARTGVEDIRPLLEGLHTFNFDLPVDLAVRPFDHIREAFN
uniref:RUN domain-containing protein n=1 Tax=Globodera rostochiensis TaxID=31243 RepID=A0A914HJW8_GLORO